MQSNSPRIIPLFSQMRSLLYIVISLIITGCSFSGSGPKELDEARRLLGSDPGAALSKLNGIDVSELPDSATMASWALLYSEAMVANRLTAPTDTIIDIAVDYYGNHNLRDEFQRASRLKALIKASDNRDELASALYLQKEKEFMLFKERTRREHMLFAGMAMFLLAAGIIVWMRQRMKLQSARNDALMAEASCLKCRIEEQSNDVNRLETTLRGMLGQRFALIDTLCQTYYESQGTKTERKAIAEKVKSEIEAVRTDAFPEMESTVNNCRNGMLDRVKTAWPEIKPEEYQLLVYLAGGLSPRAISLLIGQSVDVVYKRKSRLKGRLKSLIPSFHTDFSDIF